jgi:hypothetical protein
MKRLKTILLFLIICISCFGQNRTRTQRVIWEYKVVKVNDRFYNNSDFRFNPPMFHDQTAMLNKMGNEGWELVNVYTEVSTVVGDVEPQQLKLYRINGSTIKTYNFNDSSIKTQVINFVFKRPKSEK